MGIHSDCSELLGEVGGECLTTYLGHHAKLYVPINIQTTVLYSHPEYPLSVLEFWVLGGEYCTVSVYRNINKYYRHHFSRYWSVKH